MKPGERDAMVERAREAFPVTRRLAYLDIRSILVARA